MTAAANPGGRTPRKVKAHEVRAGDLVGEGGAAIVHSVDSSDPIHLRFDTSLGVFYNRPYAEVTVYRAEVAQ